MKTRTWAGSALLGSLSLLLVSPAAGQEHAIAFEGNFQGYTFEDGASVKALNLFILPVGYRVPVGERVVLDLYGAWARGQVEVQNQTYELAGPVDAQVKARFQATPWALLSVSANLPTGKATHDVEEAVVAGVLSSDLFGFRESVWGNGLSITTGVATAAQMGTLGVGIGASYRLASEFQPEEGLDYQPGNEIRVRAGVDSNVGETGKLTLGVTFQKYAEDQANGLNLFQAGNRIMGDATLGFRAGASVWTLYGAHLRREQGDLTVRDQADQVVDTVETPSQNLTSGGITGTFPLGAFDLRLLADGRVQTRDNPDGTEEGSGWIAGVGAEIPFRVGSRATLLPSGRFTTGSLKDAGDVDRSVSGISAGVILRIDLGG